MTSARTASRASPSRYRPSRQRRAERVRRGRGRFRAHAAAARRPRRGDRPAAPRLAPGAGRAWTGGAGQRRAGNRQVGARVRHCGRTARATACRVRRCAARPTTRTARCPPIIEHVRRIVGWVRRRSAAAPTSTRLERDADAGCTAARPVRAQSCGAARAAIARRALPAADDERHSELKRRINDDLAEWQIAAAERAPMVLVWEDLHWADPSTLELLGAADRAGADRTVLLVLTARPEFSDAVDGALARHADHAQPARAAADRGAGRAARRRQGAAGRGARAHRAQDRRRAAVRRGADASVLDVGVLRESAATLRADRPLSPAVDPGDPAGVADGAARPAAARARGGAARRGARARVRLRRAAGARAVDDRCCDDGLASWSRDELLYQRGRAAARDLRLQARADPGRRLPVAAQAHAPALPPPGRGASSSARRTVAEQHPELLAYHYAGAGWRRRRWTAG